MVNIQISQHMLAGSEKLENVPGESRSANDADASKFFGGGDGEDW